MLTLHSISYKTLFTTLLDEVNLSLHAGEVVALCGCNGAGKSTLLKIMAGSLLPSQGQVLLNGLPLSQWSPQQLARQRAVLPQSSSLHFSFSVFEVVMLGRFPHGGGNHCAADREVVQQALALFDVEHLARRDVTTLSGGETCRVHLARVYAQITPASSTQDAALMTPRFLLLDEPTAALDIAHQHRVLQQIQALTQHKLGVLLIVHDLNLAAQYADRMIMLKQGRVRHSGPTQALMTPAVIEECLGFQSIITPHPISQHPVMLPLTQGRTIAC